LVKRLRYLDLISFFWEKASLQREVYPKDDVKLRSIDRNVATNNFWERSKAAVIDCLAIFAVGEYSSSRRVGIWNVSWI